MDWDGIGTLALFFSSGAVVLGVIALKAYGARLASKLEIERLRGAAPPPDEVTEQIRRLEIQVHQLTERVDFTERLLGEGHPETPDSGDR